MRLQRITLFIALAIQAQVSFAQIADCRYKRPHEADIWCLYKSIRLNFNSGSPFPNPLANNGLALGKGCACLSDAEGNLLLYTDGKNLWDQSDNLIYNQLKGDLGCTQSSLILPFPSKQGRYIVFTNDLLYPQPIGTKGLNYSIIDYPAFLADSVKTTNLLPNSSEKLCAVAQGSGKGYWVAAHAWNSDQFVVYRVDASGVHNTPVTSKIGSIYSGTLQQRNMVGYMKFSADGSQLAAAIMGMNLIELFDFDHNTGILSNPRQIPGPDLNLPFGIEFSADGKFLYFTTVNPTTNASNNLYQVETGSTALFPILINSLAFDMTALQLAVDGKIYITRFKKNDMAVIQNPGRPGLDCNLNESGLGIGSLSASFGLPNLMQSFYDIPDCMYDTRCYGDATVFQLHNDANVDRIDWDFGDPAGSSNVITTSLPDLTAVHRYSGCGDYTVKYTENFGSKSFSHSLQVTVNPLPRKSFDDTVKYMIRNSPISLDAGDHLVNYTWQDNSTSRYFSVDKPGKYNVTIMDSNCCVNADTLEVILIDLFVPTAFSPNGDSYNDRLGVVGGKTNVANYSFTVFDKWGQIVWKSMNVDDGWDGNFNGSPCPADLYTWIMHFGLADSIDKNAMIKKSGSFLLLR